MIEAFGRGIDIERIKLAIKLTYLVTPTPNCIDLVVLGVLEKGVS